MQLLKLLLGMYLHVRDVFGAVVRLITVDSVGECRGIDVVGRGRGGVGGRGVNEAVVCGAGDVEGGGWGGGRGCARGGGGNVGGVGCVCGILGMRNGSWQGCVGWNAEDINVSCGEMLDSLWGHLTLHWNCWYFSSIIQYLDPLQARRQEEPQW